MKDVEEFIQHHGVKGMKWGVRRYQPYPKGKKGTFLGKRREKRAAKKQDKTQRREQYKKTTSNIRSQRQSKEITRKQATVKRIEAYHESQPKKGMYNTSYKQGKQRGLTDAQAMRNARAETRNAKSALTISAAQMAVGVAGLSAPYLSKKYKSVSPIVARAGKNFVQAAKRSPIRYVDGSKMKNIIRDAGALSGR